MKIRITGLKKFQVAGQNNAQPITGTGTFNWMSTAQQENPFAIKKTVVKADGTSVTTGNVGDGYTVYEQNNQGTPVKAENAVAITKKPSTFGQKLDGSVQYAQNALMDQYTNPFSYMNSLNTIDSVVKLATKRNQEEAEGMRMMDRNAGYNRIGDTSIDRGNYGVGPTDYGLFRPNQQGVNSPEGQYSGGRFFQIGGAAAEAEQYQVPSIDAIVGSSIVDPNMFAQQPEFAPQGFAGPAPTEFASADPGNLPLDADAMLAVIGNQESGSKDGKKALGLRTKLVGAGGKRGTASGTYQITEGTLKGIYSQHFLNQYPSFDKFKKAFDTNPDVEYAAAKTLMQDHIDNYGIYALGAWYQPSYAAKAAKGDMSVMGKVPGQDYGNKLTFGDYFNKSLNNYRQAIGMNSPGAGLSTKPGVNISNLDAGLRAFASDMFSQFPGLKISSGNDSDQHMKGSKHYKNKAIDIGANSSERGAYNRLRQFLGQNPELKQRYGIEDILDEGDHIHIEMMKTGGEYELTAEQIMQIKAMGGDVEFI